MNFIKNMLLGVLVVGLSSQTCFPVTMAVHSPVLEYSFNTWSNTVRNLATNDISKLKGKKRGASEQNGFYGLGLKFDGINDYVNVPHENSLNCTDEITVEAWVRMDDVGEIGEGTSNLIQNQYIVAKHGGTLGSSSYALVLVNAGVDYMSFNIAVDTGTEVLSIYTPANENTMLSAFSNLEWYHIMGTYDGHTAKLYVNSIEVASSVRAGTIQITDEPLRIGNRSDNTRYFDGTIDEIKIYDKVWFGTGNTYYFDSETGNDAYDCSYDFPCLSIDKAHDVPLSPGDMILFKRNSTPYVGNLIVSSSGSSVMPVVFGAYGRTYTAQPVHTASQATIQGATTDEEENASVRTAGYDYLEIRHLTLTNGRHEGDSHTNCGGGVCVQNNSIHVRVVNNRVDNSESGVMIRGSDYVGVIGNVIDRIDWETNHQYSSASGDGIYVRHQPSTPINTPHDLMIAGNDIGEAIDRQGIAVVDAEDFSIFGNYIKGGRNSVDIEPLVDKSVSNGQIKLNRISNTTEHGDHDEQWYGNPVQVRGIQVISSGGIFNNIYVWQNRVSMTRSGLKTCKGDYCYCALRSADAGETSTNVSYVGNIISNADYGLKLSNYNGQIIDCRYNVFDNVDIQFQPDPPPCTSGP